MSVDDAVLAEILPMLEIDLQAVFVFDPWEVEMIALLRKVGRRAAHMLGHRAMTRQLDPCRRLDGRVVVVVIALPALGHPDLERVDARRQMLRGRLYTES